jgi:uncharacterized protein YutD
MLYFVNACQFGCTYNKIQKLKGLLKQIRNHRRKWRRRKTNIEQKMKEIKEEKDFFF